MELVIDANNCIAGRLASYVAKALLKGYRVHVINAEKAVVSGKPERVKQIFFEKVQRGDPYHGPFYPKQPDRIFRRMVRGMLPYKRPNGRKAYKRLRVYIGVPDGLKGREAQIVKSAQNNLKCRWISLGELSVHLGAKKRW